MPDHLSISEVRNYEAGILNSIVSALRARLKVNIPRALPHNCGTPRQVLPLAWLRLPLRCRSQCSSARGTPWEDTEKASDRAYKLGDVLWTSWKGCLRPLSARGFQVNECPGLESLPFDAHFHGKIMKNACETAIRCSKARLRTDLPTTIPRKAWAISRPLGDPAGGRALGNLGT